MSTADDIPAAEGRRDDDPRDDPMAPPAEPCECWCMHCRRVFMSSGMWFQRIVGAPADELQGFWMCPTPNCDGAGFTFDIFPTDPDHPGNAGWSYSDDDEEEFIDDDDGEGQEGEGEEGEAVDADWDPDESKWKQLDEEMEGFEDDDDDLEGEEWKHGLAPGERPPEPAWMEEARREQEARERQYDEPDRRPREVPWVDRGKTQFSDDDIPF